MSDRAVPFDTDVIRELFELCLRAESVDALFVDLLSLGTEDDVFDESGQHADVRSFDDVQLLELFLGVIHHLTFAHECHRA